VWLNWSSFLRRGNWEWKKDIDAWINRDQDASYGRRGAQLAAEISPVDESRAYLWRSVDSS
jgi:hypothetical protein